MRIRGKPEKLTGKGAYKVLTVDEYGQQAVKPITGNKELVNESVKVNGLVKVNVILFVIALKDNNHVELIMESQVEIKLLTL